MSTAAIYDWDAIETEYVVGNITYRELCSKYGVSESRLTKVAIERNWTAKRKEYRERLRQEAIERTLETQVASKVEFDLLTDNACDGMVRRIARAVVEDQFTAKDLIQLPSSLKTLQDIKYRRLDIPSPTQRHEINDLTPPGEADEEDIAARVDAALEKFHGNGYDASGDGNTDGQDD
ncbi:hypothetical protein AMJ86_01100 [bacterium SM23_57]|nr:MAG: hypothetical protein AMJ86_01100 [bacterium SM23_57]